MVNFQQSQQRLKATPLRVAVTGKFPCLPQPCLLTSDQPLLCAHAGSPTRLAIVTEVVSSTSSPSWDVFPDQSRRTQIIPDYVTNHSAERMCP